MAILAIAIGIEMITSNILNGLGSLILNMTNTEIGIITRAVISTTKKSVFPLIGFSMSSAPIGRITIIMIARISEITAEAMTTTFFIL